MKNQLVLSDEELALVATALQFTILHYEKYVQLRGEDGLDVTTKEAHIGMKKLHEKLSKDHY